MGTVRTRGQRIFLDFRYKGIRCREAIKLPPTPENLRWAAQLLSSVEFEIAAGQFRYSERFPDSSNAVRFDDVRLTTGTIGQFLDDYLAAMKPTLSKSAYLDYCSAARHHLKPAFGSLPLRELTTKHIRDWIGTLSISHKRINNVLVPLRGMLADAFADGYIDRNPVDRVRALRVRSRAPDPFSPSEIQAILAACTQEQHRNLFQFAFFTGLRTGELIALEWSDVDMAKGVFQVRRSYVRRETKLPKTASGERQVLLLQPARAALESQYPLTGSSVRVFLNPATGKPWQGDGQIRKTAWKPALLRAGVRYRYPYQTRHTFASMMLSAGENPAWIAKQMGHKDWGMIRKVYARWLPDAMPGAGSKAQQLFCA